MSSNRFGLIVGCLMAILHAVWLIAIAITPSGVAAFFNWILKLHHVRMPFMILPFDFMNAVMLVVITFVVGYIVGFIIGKLYHALKG